MEDFYFTCPKCGSHYFGRDVIAGKDGPVVLKTVRCHGDTSAGKQCRWHGEWIDGFMEAAESTRDRQVPESVPNIKLESV